jgi:hypothetical protein
MLKFGENFPEFDTRGDCFGDHLLVSLSSAFVSRLRIVIGIIVL